MKNSDPSIMDQESYLELCKANSGAIRFQVKSISGYAQLFLSEINSPHKDLYDICLSSHSRIGEVEHHQNDAIAETSYINLSAQFQEFWLTWYGGNICLGFADQTEPFLTYTYDVKKMIGYIKFVRKLATHHLIEWIYEKSPIISNALQPKRLRSGELRWVTLVDNRLPPDALIAGFENEPLYIACAPHERSMCPGKYVPSKRRAFVPWGGREHEKKEFQILCGYNATWVETEGDRIPQNAFIGGKSENRHQEPLYIGRAVLDGHLITGKIHVTYHTCYLPYKGKEVEVYSSYEILVLPDVNYRGIFAGVESKLE